MKTTEHSLLLESIESLKIKQSRELNDLNQQFNIVTESLKPLNIIKSTFYGNGSSGAPGDFKKALLSNAIGLASGYVSGKLLLSPTHNPIKRLLGGILQFTIGKFVAKKLG